MQAMLSGSRVAFLAHRFIIYVTFFSCLYVTPSRAQSEPIISRRAAESLVKSRSTGINQEKVDIAEVQAHLSWVNANLSDLQAREVDSYMRFLSGASASLSLNEATSYSLARAQSRQNLIRLTKDQEAIQSTFEFTVAKKKLTQSLRRFRHNMVEAPKSVEDVPMWLSSAQIQSFGLRGGLQGAKPFNREYLRTQNWIFFFVTQDNDFSYGSYRVFVDGDYASRRGLIFPYVMEISELVIAGCRMNQAACAEYRALFETIYTKARDGVDDFERETRRPFTESERLYFLTHGTWRDDVDTVELIEKHADIFATFRKSLLEYMFTIDDYKTLVATKLAAYLLKVRKQNPPLYVRDLGILMTSGLSQLNTLLADQLIARVLQAAGLPERYEMRIPVGIPRENLDLREVGCEKSLL